PAVSDPALEAVRDKVVGRETLSYDDGVALYRSRDVHGIGRLANFVRERLHGDRTYYNRNRHINYTNVCALSCKFCSFYRKRGEEIFDDRVHDEVFKGKVGANKWFEVHRTAHELGIYTNATMLYGHVERPEERVNHLIKLRELQRESLSRRAASFNCVIPLSF